MPELIEQFCTATREWTAKTRAYELNEVIACVASWTGRDPAQLVTIPQMRSRLYELVNDVGLDEQFLVLSLVWAIQDEFDWIAENEPVDREQPAPMVAHLEAILTDPARRDAYIHTKNQELTDDGNEPVTRATIEELIEDLRHRNTGDYADQRTRRYQRDTWREVTAPFRDHDVLGRTPRPWEAPYDG